MIHRSEGKNRTRDHGLAVSYGSRHRQRRQDTLVLWLQDAQINRTQLVTRTGGAYPAALLGSTDAVCMGRTRTSRLARKYIQTNAQRPAADRWSE